MLKIAGKCKKVHAFLLKIAKKCNKLQEIACFLSKNARVVGAKALGLKLGLIGFISPAGAGREDFT